MCYSMIGIIKKKKLNRGVRQEFLDTVEKGGGSNFEQGDE